MNLMKISLLVFDNDFYLFKEIFEPLSYYYADTSSNTISYTVKFTSYEVLRFITYCNIETSNTGSGTITFLMNFSYGTNTFSMNPTISGPNLNNAYVEGKILAVYPQQATNYGFILEVFSSEILTTPPLTDNRTLKNYYPGKSVFF